MKKAVRENEEISQILQGVGGVDFFEISYEDIFGLHGDDRMVETWNRVLHFLGQRKGTFFDLE